MEWLATFIWPFLQWLWQTTLIASLVICLILAVQKSLGHKLGPRWSHALWLVLLIRMVVPWAPQSRISLLNLLPSSVRQAQPPAVSTLAEQDLGLHSAAVSDAAETVALQDATSSPSTHVAAPPKPQTLAGAEQPSGPAFLPLRHVLPVLWLAGAALVGAYLFAGHFALWRIVKRDRPLVDQSTLELFEECKAQMGVQTLVAAVPSDRIASPALFGFVRPRLLLPRQMLDTASRDEMRYVFLHELAHLKRHDIYLAWVASLLQVLHWFNPLVWFAFHRMRIDREMACDALVLAYTGEQESHEYGRAIVALLQRLSRSRPLPAMAGILESKSQLKRRIAMIAQFRNSSYRWSALGIGVIVVLSAISMIDPRRDAVSASSTPQGKTALTIRLVEMRGTSHHETVSPDGRYLCDPDEKEGAITIREFATGEKRTIKPTVDTPEGERPFFWPVLMSPDSKAVAYGVGGNSTEYLCLIGADGSGQRVICSDVMPAQWFPDGSRILGILMPGPESNDARDIVSVSVSDGSVEKIKYLKTAYGSWSTAGLGLSPDAQYVASDVGHEDRSMGCDIVAVEIDSKQEMPLVRHPADDRLLGWTPDGGHILFASNRMGAWDAYLLPVAKGRAQGTPEMVVRNVNISFGRAKGFASNGSYYYQVDYSGGTVYTAGIDLTAGRLLSPPAPLGAAGSSSCADWSPDGKRLAYCPYPERQRLSNVIRIRTLATGEEREVIHKLGGWIECLRWSRDGRSLLASGLMAPDKEHLQLLLRVYRVDVETGDSTILLQAKTEGTYMVRRAELSPDEKTLFYSLSLDPDGSALVRREIDTGEEKNIFDFPSSSLLGSRTTAPWALSPNGEYIAAGLSGKPSLPRKIVIIPSRGGQVTELLRWDETPGQINELAWSADNKTVLFAFQGKLGTIEFWQVTMDGGQPRKISETDLGSEECLSLRVHPDSQRIAFTTYMWRNELWVMENFLPAGIGVKDSK